MTKLRLRQVKITIFFKCRESTECRLVTATKDLLLMTHHLSINGDGKRYRTKSISENELVGLVL